MIRLLRSIFAFLMLAAAVPMQAQPGYRPTLNIDECTLKENYIPYDTGQMPIKRVRLTVHVFGKNDGSGNFQNIPEHNEFLDRIWNHVNWIYREPEPFRPVAEGQEYVFIPDTRVRFVIDTILYHRDDEAWNFRKYTCTFDKIKQDSVYREGRAHRRADELHKQYVQNNEALSPRLRDSSIHIFMLEIKDYHNRGMAHSLFSKKWLFYIGAWHLFSTDSTGKPDHWHPGKVFAHELGHAMGLSHPYNYGECDDLPFTPPGTTNDIVDTWPNEGQAFTPQQLGLIHLGLSGYRGDIGDALIRDWYEYSPDKTLIIEAGDTVRWKGKRYLQGDLILRGGAVLVVECDVEMPPTAMIKINPEAVLIVNKGEIRGAGGQQWDAIHLVKQRRFLFFGKKREGSYILKNDATVKDNKRGVVEVVL